jgi:hypothetical protein
VEDFAADKLRILADAVANTRDYSAALANVAKVVVQLSMLQRGEKLPAEETEEEKQNPIPDFLRGGPFQAKGKVSQAEKPAANDPERQGQ